MPFTGAALFIFFSVCLVSCIVFVWGDSFSTCCFHFSLLSLRCPFVFTPTTPITHPHFSPATARPMRLLLSFSTDHMKDSLRRLAATALFPGLFPLVICPFPAAAEFGNDCVVLRTGSTEHSRDSRRFFLNICLIFPGWRRAIGLSCTSRSANQPLI